MKKIYFTVTNDLVYDQRMARICGTLAAAGYSVVLVGRRGRHSPEPIEHNYKQKRLFCIFQKGKLFYLEFNLRLFFYLLFRRATVLCAIDLDTILPVYLVSVFRGVSRVYDAHELFCEMKEVVTRPFVYRCWKTLEQWLVPKFKFGYTVCEPIASELKADYQVDYQIIRNMPMSKNLPDVSKKEKFILYQGAVNEGRCFETLIPAMNMVDVPLIICGDGNYMPQARKLVSDNKLEHRVIFKGMLRPPELEIYTNTACIGITLFENKGKSNYYSLANRFFDYIHADVPQIAMNYPAYAEINRQFEVAVLLDEPSVEAIATALNNLLTTDVLYQNLREQCDHARKLLNWETEQEKLLFFYKQLVE